MSLVVTVLYYLLVAGVSLVLIANFVRSRRWQQEILYLLVLLPFLLRLLMLLFGLGLSCCVHVSELQQGIKGFRLFGSNTVRGVMNRLELAFNCFSVGAGRLLVDMEEIFVRLT